MKWIVLVFPILLFICPLKAQIHVAEDEGINTMVQRHIEINKSRQFLSGYRVQLIATSNRTRVMELKTEFLKKYPRISIDWDYSAPYYKLKAGSFLTKLEATNLKHRIRYDYPDAYITKDKVRPRDL